MTLETAPRGVAPPLRLPRSEHIVRHLRLAVPVMLSRAGLIILFSVDSIVTGRAGTSQLAHCAPARPLRASSPTARQLAHCAPARPLRDRAGLRPGAARMALRRRRAPPGGPGLSTPTATPDRAHRRY
jgi:hypothetical protein